jgi:hypothetical protein
MTRFLIALPAFAILCPTAGIAAPMGENPAIEQARVEYRQCLGRSAARASRMAIADEDSFAMAKASCAPNRDAIIAASGGNIDVVDALDRLDARAAVTFAERTRAIRAMRIAYQK